MNKRTMVIVALAGQLLITGFAAAGKSDKPKASSGEPFPALPKSNVIQHPLVPSTVFSSVPSSSSGASIPVAEPLPAGQTNNNSVATQIAVIDSTNNLKQEAPATTAPAAPIIEQTLAQAKQETTPPATTAVRFSLNRSNYVPKPAY